jgi:hypothetical protein
MSAKKEKPSQEHISEQITKLRDNLNKFVADLALTQIEIDCIDYKYYKDREKISNQYNIIFDKFKKVPDFLNPIKQKLEDIEEVLGDTTEEKFIFSQIKNIKYILVAFNSSSIELLVEFLSRISHRLDNINNNTLNGVRSEHLNRKDLDLDNKIRNRTRAKLIEKFDITSA